jgi:hypothetical protein
MDGRCCVAHSVRPDCTVGKQTVANLLMVHATAGRLGLTAGEPLRSFRGLLDYMATLMRNTITLRPGNLDKVTLPTPCCPCHSSTTSCCHGAASAGIVTSVPSAS